MYVDSQDWRPPSALKRPRMGAEQIIFGLLSAVGAPMLFLVSVVALAGAFGLLDDVFGGDDGPQINEEDVIEARFVQLGEERDPEKLPNRHVPIKETAPKNRIAPTKNPTEQQEVEEPPPDATEDLMKRLGDRAQAFAEIAEKREREGSPDGIEGGTATEATPGNIWAGKLVAFLRRGWEVPTTISDADRKELMTVVDVKVGTDLTIQDFRLRTESGNPLFDQSALNRLQQLKSQGTTVPEPPNDEVADKYLGSWIGARFRGRDAD